MFSLSNSSTGCGDHGLRRLAGSVSSFGGEGGFSLQKGCSFLGGQADALKLVVGSGGYVGCRLHLVQLSTHPPQRCVLWGLYCESHGSTRYCRVRTCSGTTLRRPDRVRGAVLSSTFTKVMELTRSIFLGMC